MSEIGKRFKDIQLYNSNMRKSLGDKLYFLEHLPDCSFTLVDFGCADGSLINELCSIFRNYEHEVRFIGYDCSEEMINLARSNFYGEVSDDVTFTNSWDVVKKKLLGEEDLNVDLNRKNVLILSSVIHEVYSYAKDQEEIDEFWDRVLNSGFDYIVIRDMMLDPGIERARAGMYDMCQVKNSSKYESYQYDSFKEKWGGIVSQKNLIHFLLKYRWKVNWERELNENYFPINTAELYDKIILSGNYRLDYWERFRVPFLDECFKRDFNIELDEYTHLKAIFRRYNFSEPNDAPAGN